MIIYKTTNLINNKIYIGKDVHNNPNYYGSGKLIINAIKKYGKENFKKEILEICYNNEQLSDREHYWILYFDSMNKKIGYNIMPGGFGGNTRINYGISDMDVYKEKMSIAVKNSDKYKRFVNSIRGVPRPEHSKILKNLYSSGKLKPWNLGLPTSPDIKLKISIKNRGRKHTLESKNKISKSKFKPVYMCDDFGNILQEFESIKYAAEYLKIGRDSIYGCCIGKYKKGAGFKWKYK